jgi:hypothetical protein
MRRCERSDCFDEVDCPVRDELRAENEWNLPMAREIEQQKRVIARQDHEILTLKAALQQTRARIVEQNRQIFDQREAIAALQRQIETLLARGNPLTREPRKETA